MHIAHLSRIVSELKITSSNVTFLFSFSLTKKKQKVKAKDQPPFAPQNLRRMVVRSLSPKAAALLPAYDRRSLKPKAHQFREKMGF